MCLRIVLTDAKPQFFQLIDMHRVSQKKSTINNNNNNNNNNDNKTIGDEGITIDFWIIKVYTSN